MDAAWCHLQQRQPPLLPGRRARIHRQDRQHQRHHVAHYRYDAWGVDTTIVGNAYNRFRYAGGYKDDTTNLTKFGARYYDPQLGRWTQPDPSGLDEHFLYSGNNPTNFTDLTGYAFWDDALEYADAASDLIFGGSVTGSDSSAELWGAVLGEVAGIVTQSACIGVLAYATAGVGTAASWTCFALGQTASVVAGGLVTEELS